MMYELRYLNEDQKNEIFNRHASQAEADWLNITINAAKAERQGNADQARTLREAAEQALDVLRVIEAFRDLDKDEPIQNSSVGESPRPKSSLN